MEDITKKTIKIARTKTGSPCLWESLVNFDDLKRSTVILDREGNPKKAVFLNETREKQALVPIIPGDHVAKSFEDKHGVAISVFRIEEISAMGNEAVIVPVYRKSSLVSEYEVPEAYKSMVHYTVSKLRGEFGVVSEKQAVA